MLAILSKNWLLFLMFIDNKTCAWHCYSCSGYSAGCTTIRTDCFISPNKICYEYLHWIDINQNEIQLEIVNSFHHEESNEKWMEVDNFSSNGKLVIMHFHQKKTIFKCFWIFFCYCLRPIMKLYFRLVYR